MPAQIVLASTSSFRRQLLQRLGLRFDTAAPHIDETARAGEPAETLVTRLAFEKAQAVAHQHPAALIIGSDQVACIDGRILGKPGGRAQAIAQLTAASGKRVSFYTGLCLLNTETGKAQILCEPFHVVFRSLNREQIARYIDAERPFNCAGSFRSEGLGVSLFARLEGDDPNALIGLPLIKLVTLLNSEGIAIP